MPCGTHGPGRLVVFSSILKCSFFLALALIFVLPNAHSPWHLNLPLLPSFMFKSFGSELVWIFSQTMASHFLKCPVLQLMSLDHATCHQVVTSKDRCSDHLIHYRYSVLHHCLPCHFSFYWFFYSKFLALQLLVIPLMTLMTFPSTKSHSTDKPLLPSVLRGNPTALDHQYLRMLSRTWLLRQPIQLQCMKPFPFTRPLCFPLTSRFASDLTISIFRQTYCQYLL